MPTLAALWQTSYGLAILVKAGLLVAAMGLGAGNMLRTKPRLVAAGDRPEAGQPAARLLRRRISGEAVAVAGLCSLPRALEPRPAAARVRGGELRSHASGRDSRRDRKQAGYVLQVLVTPNKAAAPDSFALRITKNGQPVRGANVTLTFTTPRCRCPNRNTS